MPAEHPYTLWEASLPCLPSSLTWCPSVHDGKHINSYGSSIKQRECAETIGHRVFLHRNHEKREMLGFHTRFTSAWTSMWKTFALKSVPGRWSFLMLRKGWQPSWLYPNRQCWSWQVPALWGSLTLSVGTRDLCYTFQSAAECPGAGFFLQVCSYLFSVQNKESLSLRWLKGAK